MNFKGLGLNHTISVVFDGAKSQKNHLFGLFLAFWCLQKPQLMCDLALML
jgi:hypothetical protein